jgi:hypothetical protein
LPVELGRVHAEALRDAVRVPPNRDNRNLPRKTDSTHGKLSSAEIGIGAKAESYYG